MDTIRLVAKEIICRRRKALASLLCVVLAITVVVAAQTLSKALYDEAKEQLLRFGANILVQPSGSDWAVAASAAGQSLIPESYVNNIRRIEHSKMLVAVSPMLVQRFPIMGIGMPVVGITPEERKAKPWWLIDQQVLPPGLLAGDVALLGYYAAQRLGKPSAIEIGDRHFEVAGTLDKTGSSEDEMVFVPLADLQQLTGTEGMVSRIEVTTSCIACGSMNVSDIADDIRKELPEDAAVTTVKRIAEAQMGTLNRIQSFLNIVSVVMLFLSALLLMNQASSSVADRRREIGMLLAMGMDARRIYATFIMKAVLIGIVGGALGFGVGTILSITLGGYMAGASVSPLYHLLGYAVLASVVICVASSVLPARQAVRIDPVVALREL